jgi:hypothetical protein
MPPEASTAREKGHIVKIVVSDQAALTVGQIVFLAKTSHLPKLRGSSCELWANKTRGTDGRQILEPQACGATAQAPPQAKNSESPGERGLAEGAAEKEEGIGWSVCVRQ